MTAMRTSMFVAAIILVAWTSYAESLECYQCANTETDGSNSFLKLFKGDTDPNCKNPGIYTSSVTCPNGYEYKCGYTEAKVKQNFIVGDLSMKVQARGCMETSADDGCYTGNEDVKGLLNAFLSLDGMTVDGKICYCSDDLCDAECGGDSWQIQDLCVKKWQAVLAGIAGLIVLGLILSCCCCCCCCCRCCRTDGTVLVTNPAATVMSSPYTPAPQQGHGISGRENPGYDLAMPSTQYTELKAAV